MHLRYRFLLLVLPVLLIPFAASAGVVLSLAADPTDSECHIADPGPNGVTTVYVLLTPGGLTGPPGAAGVSFAAPIPANSGLTYVSEASPFLRHGNSQTGVDVALGCLVPSSPTVVMTITFLRTSAGEPCTVYELASPPTFSPTVMDCDFDTFPLQVFDGVVLNSDGTCDQATDPNPPDGTNDVPIVTTLQWKAPYVCNVLLHGETTVFFGTSTDPPVVGYGESPFPVGPLAPETTYHWKIWDNDAGQAGPLWSFTTTQIVATKPSTWGAIKALYRN